MATVLITGGSGLVGRALTSSLLADGHMVRYLGRGARPVPGVAVFRWDVARREVDGQALNGVDHIVHLAGAGIADKRWTPARVRELIASRADSILLLLKVAKEQGTLPGSMVSAAGINYYGAVSGGHRFTEDDPPGTDTIGHISHEWEKAVDQWGTECRTVKLRTPVVLAREGGALPKLAMPVRFGLGAALGSGKQWMPWVHIDDLVRAYRLAIADEGMRGACNVNTGNDVVNAEFMRTVAKVLGRPFFLPPVPGFALKLAFGELASVLLEGSQASNAKLLATGFRFRHPELEGALRDLLGGRPPDRGA